MNNELREIVKKIIIKLLELEKSSSISNEISIKIKDVAEDEKDMNVMGSYMFVRSENGNKSIKITIVGRRNKNNFSVSEVEVYNYKNSNYESFRNEELYSKELLQTLESIWELLERE